MNALVVDEMIKWLPSEFAIVTANRFFSRDEASWFFARLDGDSLQRCDIFCEAFDVRVARDYSHDCKGFVLTFRHKTIFVDQSCDTQTLIRTLHENRIWVKNSRSGRYCFEQIRFRIQNRFGLPVEIFDIKEWPTRSAIAIAPRPAKEPS